jgi:ParB family chromosome partitioning protein
VASGARLEEDLMATAAQNVILCLSCDIPFNKLALSQFNVRRIKVGVSVEELA